MSSNEPEQHSEVVATGEKSEPDIQPQHLLPAAIQPVNVFAIEIMAKRYPVVVTGSVMAQTNIQVEELQLDEATSHGQVILSVQINFPEEPRPFEISFKLVGIFAYTHEIATTDVSQFLNQGSLSILLPFARELLLSICTRLQVPLVMLQMIQLVPPPPPPENKEEV